MAIGSIIGQAVGGVAGAWGAQVQGQQEANSLEYQATIQKRNAQEALMAAKFNADRLSLSANKMMGAASAGYGAGGVDSSSGSVLSVLAASSANAELDRLNILHGGEMRAVNYENQASIDDLGAKHAIDASYFNSFSALLGSGSKIGSEIGGGGKGDKSATPKDVGDNT